MSRSPLFRGILVVEDEPGLRLVIESVLTGAGYRVVSATDGEQALALALADPQLQLILTDVRLPKKDGMQLLTELMQAAPERTVIVMSAYGSIEMAVSALQAGAYHFLSKPFGKDVLLHTVRKAEERFALIEENRNLKSRLTGRDPDGMLIGVSPSIQQVLQKVQKIASFQSTVLITGESGTGKEVVARLIHGLRTDPGPFVAVNCGAIPENLLESELFGVVRGAYTGATENRTGLLAQAHQGTLFLDEVGELPLALQVKLLRVIQEGVFRPLGSGQETRVVVRWMAATARDLPSAVSAGTFREDLYYRLNVVPIHLPPLRERPEDLLLLARHFLTRSARRHGVEEKVLSPAAAARLTTHPWPGNVRELENWMERVTILCEHREIQPEDLPGAPAGNTPSLQEKVSAETLSIKQATKDIEKILIVKALKITGGKKFAASQLLEISERALQYKMKVYQIKESEKGTFR
ncbi:sigma-54 dependent transcriptional regulator [Myxococcota bacterium]|nr:sigma-54 dependent transcriptional regulator [Myxococcota bacterium]MBU1411671.1 sigma-54 dependent transcriptional regulator [Myxococcota bacterium]MBU1508954.1 sigma-54 dependent transcriptional regulator [Myxococcota bacterium]